MMEKYGLTAAPMLPTMSGGQSPIGGIFLPSYLRIIHIYYLGFGYFYFDHRLFWVNVLIGNYFGHLFLPLMIPNARCLQVKNSQLVDKFDHLIERPLDLAWNNPYVQGGYYAHDEV